MYFVHRTEEFIEWLDNLKDMQSFALITKRLHRIVNGNLGDYKSVGNKIFELRINCGPGYRLYFIKKKDEIILLLIGGDKSTQKRDIEKAKALAAEYEE